MLQHTLAMVKSHQLHNAHRIIGRAGRAGLLIFSAGAPQQLTQYEAKTFYAEHEGRVYFDALIKSVTDGPVVLAVLSGENAIARWRRLLGPTDPEKAPPGCIRGDYGWQMPDNAAHGSDSVESALREIALMMPDYVARFAMTIQDAGI